MNRHVGHMPAGMLTRFLSGQETREAMDDEVRKHFKIPSHRYYTVSLPPGAAGAVFVDHSRTRVITAHKISKSDH